MGRVFLVLLFLIGFGTLAYAQAMLRVGDPIELKIGGVPNEEQQQVNIYTVDSNGSVNLPYINTSSGRGVNARATGPLD
jgi:protein involved in polysaccharide export with SLBB domain